MPTVITRGAASAFALGFGASAGGESYWSVGSFGTGTSQYYPNMLSDGPLIVEAGDGSVYFIDSGSFITNPGIVVTKTSAKGDLLWENRYTSSSINNGSNVYPSSAAIDSSGNLYILIGVAVSSTTPLCILKISSSGSVVASALKQRLGGGNAGQGGSIGISPTGEVFVAYYDYANNAGILQKIDPTTLAVLYANQWSGRNYFQNTLAFAADGSYLIIGGKSSTANRIDKFQTSDLSYIEGRTLTYAAGTQNGAFSLAMDASNNVYVVFVGPAQTVITKINANLNSAAWGFYTNMTGSSVPKSYKVSVTTSGDVYFSGGYAQSYNLGYTSVQPYFLARLTQSGTMVYSRNLINDYAGNVAGIPDRTGLKAIYMATGLTANGPYANQTMYMRMPINGDGIGIYSNSVYYFNYGDGPSFASATVSVLTSSIGVSSQFMSESGITFTAATNTRTRVVSTIISPASSYSATYATPGTYTWIAPAGVTSVSAVCVGGGGGGQYGGGGGGGGGALAYKNNISVTPSSSYTVVVGAGGAGGALFSAAPAGSQSYFSSASTVAANGGAGGWNPGGAGGTVAAGTGGSGGKGGDPVGGSGAGGGGAGGYSGTGGAGGNGNFNASPTAGAAGSGGAAGGGASGIQYGANAYSGGSLGGGVGILGQGTSGASSTGVGNQGSTSWPFNFGAGGGAGGQYFVFCGCYPCCSGWVYETGGSGRSGVVRIVWGSAARTFPSTNVSAP